MSAPDYRMQQELEHEHHATLMGILRRIKRGLATESGALVLAGELGLANDFNRRIDDEYHSPQNTADQRIEI